MEKTAAWIFLSLTIVLAAYGVVLTVMWNKEKKKSAGGPAKMSLNPDGSINTRLASSAGQRKIYVKTDKNGDLFCVDGSNTIIPNCPATA